MPPSVAPRSPALRARCRRGDRSASAADLPGGALLLLFLVFNLLLAILSPPRAPSSSSSSSSKSSPFLSSSPRGAGSSLLWLLIHPPLAHLRGRCRRRLLAHPSGARSRAQAAASHAVAPTRAEAPPAPAPPPRAPPGDALRRRVRCGTARDAACAEGAPAQTTLRLPMGPPGPAGGEGGVPASGGARRGEGQRLLTGGGERPLRQVPPARAGPSPSPHSGPRSRRGAGAGGRFGGCHDAAANARRCRGPRCRAPRGAHFARPAPQQPGTTWLGAAITPWGRGTGLRGAERG